MKKLISILLACTLLLALFVPAMAAEETYPTIYIEGQGIGLYRPDGSQVYPLAEDVATLVKDNLKDLLMEYASCMLSRDFTSYNDKLYNLIAPLYEDVKLGPDGTPTDGSGVASDINWKVSLSNIKKTIDLTDGSYSVYRWHYDWRLSPLTLAAELDELVTAVLADSGKSKVNIICRCLGTNIAYTYLHEYDHSKVNSCVFYAPSIDGLGILNALFSGKFVFDAGAVNRFAEYFRDEKNLTIRDEETTDLIMTTLTLFEQTGVLDQGTGLMDKIVDNVKDDVIPRILKASYGTFPSYWAMLSPSYVEDAKDFVFKTDKDEYAGLIEKIDAYAAIVNDSHSFLQSIADDVRIAVVAKYGFPAFPLSEDAAEESDVFVTTGLASLGATCASSGGKLDSKYIKAQTAAGKGEYISADGKIDASTALFPGTTWFIKGLEHKAFPDCVNDLMVAFINTPDMTVKTDARFTQFLQFNPSNDESSDSAKGTLTPILTAEDTVDTTQQYSSGPLDAFFKFLQKIIRFFTKLFKK